VKEEVTMRAKILTLAGVAVAAAALPLASFAGGSRVGVSIAIGGPPVAYYPPPPVVYYSPPPVAYYPPPVAYYPRPYYAPSATIVFRSGGYYGGPGYEGYGYRGGYGYPGYGHSRKGGYYGAGRHWH
jgi:hypothetical protein